LRHLTVGQTLSIARNGGLAQVATLHEAMLERGIRSRLLFVDWRGSSSTPAESVRLSGTCGNPFFFGWSSASRVRSAVEEADVVHVHGMYTYLNLLAGRYCRRFGKALIYHPHGALVPEFLRSGRMKKSIAMRAFELRNFRQMAAWRALTSVEARQIRDIDPRANVFVVSNGVKISRDVSRPTGSHPRLSLTTDPAKRVFLYLARISASKGLDLLLDAWHGASRRLRSCELWIAGADRDGTERKLRKTVQDRRMENVRLVGGVADQEKDWLLRASDVFVLTSRGEGQSPAVLEAMACGRPALLTTTCFLSNAISVGAGLECEPETAGILEALIRFASMSALEIEGMGRKGRAFVEKEHDIADVATALDLGTEAALAQARK
jgi:glycosyltransferase involved in cell wall biosynthesis